MIDPRCYNGRKTIDQACLHELIAFVTTRGWKVTSSVGGKHNKCSLHYIGHAVDVSVRGKDQAHILALEDACKKAGYILRDERVRPPGQRIWGGPHLHIEKPL